MNLVEVEKLAILAQNGDLKAKEYLTEEFKPLILNICKRTFLNGFEFEDIQNECYASLFKALKKYNPEKHRFVAYATITIKNSIISLMKRSKTRDKFDSKSTLILTNNLEYILSNDLELVEDRVMKEMFRSKINTAFNMLEDEERKLIDYVYVKGNPLKKYAERINLSYSRVFKIKKKIVRKLYKFINEEETWI